MKSNGKGQNTGVMRSKGETLYTYNKFKSLIVDAIAFVASHIVANFLTDN
ncbi:hypothetical protein [Nostoc sp. NMS4]|nr:hypothetical protein [Nostoc sp. NMS4]MBN3927729.1 hypothetical protein [Nostoc sp. NMS4]